MGDLHDATPSTPVEEHLAACAPGVVAVVVTRDRPALLEQCLQALHRQFPPPSAIIVVDNASGPETKHVLRRHPGLQVLTMVRNTGGAGGFWAGIAYALDRGAEWLWLMDDDGRPARPDCLAHLLNTAQTAEADMVGALVIDADRPSRLAFPVRLHGRTVFDAQTVRSHGPVAGFAHLFNGVLVHARLFRAIGLPDPRFLIRGDEVEFLYRARRAGATVLIDPGAPFLHPGSAPEIHSILGGRFYAVVPGTPEKRFLQYRNRAYIFSRYGMWGWLLADIVRYSCHHLGRRDLLGFAHWARATLCGLNGRFMRARPRGRAAARRLGGHDRRGV